MTVIVTACYLLLGKPMCGDYYLPLDDYVTETQCVMGVGYAAAVSFVVQNGLTMRRYKCVKGNEA